MDDVEDLLVVDGLSKDYGDFTALSGLSLSVRPGEAYGLLGPNGAGKTTTIKLLMGLLRPTSGEARVAGLDCFSDRADNKRYVGYLPDEPDFPDYLRGIEILRFVASMHGIDPQVADRTIRPLLERFKLDDADEEFAVNYSQGMRKKLALTAALLHDPPLLILDEPTAGLDPYATRTLHELIRERVEGGRSVLLSTHLLDQAEKVCDRAGVLYGGELAAAGSLQELRDRAGLPDATLEQLFFHFTGASADDFAQ